MTRRRLLASSSSVLVLAALLGCGCEASEAGPAAAPARPALAPGPAETTGSGFELDPELGPLAEGPPLPASSSSPARERPEGHLRPGVPEVSPPEHIELARAAMRQRGWQLRACYEAALPARPKLAGELRLRFSITTAGRVVEPELRGLEGFDHPGVAGCMERAIGRWRFPGPPEAIEVAYPLELRPG